MLEDLRSERDLALDASAVKRDDFNHARESFAGMRQLAKRTLNPERSSDAERKVKARLKDPYRRAKRVNASVPKASLYVTQQLEDAGIWLSCNRSELPVEIETESGRLNVGGKESANPEPDAENVDLSMQDSWALDVFGWSCHKDLDGSARDIGGEVLELYQTYGPVHDVRLAILEERGDKLRDAHARRDARMRWFGMEEWDAVAKADAKLAQGVTRTKAKSGAKPLPPVAELQKLFHVEDGQLMRTKLGKPIVSDRVKVGTKTYVTSRVAYAVASGVDPEDKVVRDGQASEYRTARGYVDQRPDGSWRAMVKVGDEVVTIGTYGDRAVLPTDPMADLIDGDKYVATGRRVAEEACALYIKTLENQRLTKSSP